MTEQAPDSSDIWPPAYKPGLPPPWRQVGPLLGAFDRLTEFWTNWLSIQSASSFLAPDTDSESKYLLRRDVSVLICLGLSVILLVWHPCKDVVLARMITGIASYQIINLMIVLFRLGILGHTRGESGVAALDTYRVRRLLLIVLLNYVELVFWFAAIYLFMGIRTPGAFNEPVVTPDRALFVSMSTMFTIGVTVQPVGSSFGAGSLAR